MVQAEDQRALVKGERHAALDQVNGRAEGLLTRTVSAFNVRYRCDETARVRSVSLLTAFAQSCYYFAAGLKPEVTNGTQASGGACS